MTKKKQMVMACLMAMGALQARASMVGDTLVIDQAERVKIETRDTVQRIIVSGAKDDPDFQYVQRISIADKKAVRRSIRSVKDFNKIQVKKKDGTESKVDFSPHIMVGVGTMTGAPDDCKFKLLPSFEVHLGFTADWHPYGKKNAWSAGLLVGWRNYRTDKSTKWVKDAQDMMTLTPYGPGVSSSVTTLTEFSIQVPLVYTHYFDNREGFGFSLGAIVNFNTGAHATARWSTGDYDYLETLHGLGQRVVTVDGLAVIHIPSFLDVYCKYSPMTFFRDGRGPKMHQLSFGLCL